MFGILRPRPELLDRRERERFQATYCNLCGLISAQYGFKSRMLVVYDVATLWWLLDDGSRERRPLVPLNCVRGGATRLYRHGLTDTQRLLAAISVYMAGVKVNDDLEDGGSWRSKAADALYRASFDRARQDLVGLGFDVAGIEETLREQASLESRREANFETASIPTARAYGLVAMAIARHCNPAETSDRARQMGEALGRAVYLIDAIRDYSSDRNVAYNPLCLCAAPDSDKLDSSLKQKVVAFVSEHLTAARSGAANLGTSFRNGWNAVVRHLLHTAGIKNRKSVTLYASCCFPCGDAVVQVDDKDFNVLWVPCALCCCCLVSGGKCCG